MSKQYTNILKIFKSSLIHSAGIYTVTSIINAAIPFFLMPILTRYMSPSDYGIVTMFSVLVSFIAPFTGLSIQGAIARQFYERQNVDMPTYVTNCLFILAVSSALTGAILLALCGPISKISLFPANWLWVVIVVSVANFVNSVILVLWQVQVMPYIYGQYQIAKTILDVGLSLLLIVGLGMTWQGRIEGQTITAIVMACIGLIVLRRNGWIRFRFNKKYIENALRFGLPLIPHTLGGVILTMTDRLFITKMVGLSATGLYSVGYSFGAIIGFVEHSFNLAYVPWLYERLKKNDEYVKIKIVKVTYVYFISIILLAASLSVIAPWFLSFFVGKNFSGAHVFVFWIAMGYAFNGMYKMVVNYIFYVEKTYILAWITFCCAGLNIVFNYIFITLSGPIGAAQASTLTFFLTFFITWILSNRAYKMPWFLPLRKNRVRVS